MTIKVGIVMDPIASINVKKDSTLAMLGEAQKRKWEIVYMEMRDLFARDGEVYADMAPLEVFQNTEKWFSLASKKAARLDTLDVILMRKDPPFDMQYIYVTYLLELAEKKRGVSHQ